ncbi:MAG TPA: GWxTD domain-containing protein [Patescibacteria group bacterium]|nr:GWxTD domain-containing protein [Patescibacteria group bacterium]
MSSLKRLIVSLLFFGLACAYALTPSASARGQHGDSPDQSHQLSKKKEKELMKELGNPYKKWITGPISYIITPQERKAFLQLQTNGEREQFIEEFWARRNPSPGSEENTFKDDFYRRIAYANEHFSSGIPGWRTDRGRIYIMWGPPDQVDSHPSGGTYERPAAEGGGETNTYPFSDWTYNYLPGIGNNVVLEFVDPTMTGEYYLTTDPSKKDALLYMPGGGPTLAEQMGQSSRQQRFQNTDGTHDGKPLGGVTPSYLDEFNRLELYAKIFQPPPVKFKDLEAIVTSRVIRNQLPFHYRFDFLRITDTTDLVPVSVEVPNREMSFKEKDGVQTATLHIFGRVSTLGGRIAQTFEDTVQQNIPASLFQKSLRGNAMYQKAMPLRPGLYRLDLVVKDVNSGNVGVISTRLPVPQYTDTKLSASTLILADDIQGVSSRNIGLGQFVLGDVMVRPRLGGVFQANETLGFYMQAYNLKIDPKTHHSAASIQFLVTKGDKTVLQQTETSAQLGDTGEQLTIEKRMPLAGLAPGHYKLQITIRDKVTQKDLVQSADFTVKNPRKTAGSEAKK